MRDHDLTPSSSFGENVSADERPLALREELALANIEARLTGRARQPMVGDRYAVVDVVGRGGMGEVCRAIDRRLRREVAIKLVRSDRLVGDARQRLTAEARALARLSHPNVVPVFDLVDDPRGLCLVMALVDGLDLRTWLRVGQRRPGAILDVLEDVARGLAAAHRAGVIHRDVKPDNIMVGVDGRAWVIDFGLALAALREPGSVALVGTPGYLAPELYAGASPSAATDQVGYCVTALEALCGRRPLHDTTVAALARRGAAAWRVEPPDRALPGALWGVFERGLAADPRRRHLDMDALLAALRRARRGRRHRAAIGAAAVGAAVAAAWWSTRPAGDCSAEDDRIATIWTDDSRAEIDAAFVASELPYAQVMAERVAAAIEASVDALRVDRREACRIDPPEVRDRALACIRARGEALGDRVAMLRAGDTRVLSRAVEFIAALPTSTSCADDPGQEHDPQSWLALDRARGLVAGGALAEADALVDQVRPAMASVGDRRGEIDAAQLAAEIALARGDYGRSATGFEQAYLLAIEADDPARSFAAAAGAVSLTAHRFADLDSASRWLRHAKAQLDRAPSPERAIELRLVEAGVALARRDFGVAIPLYQRAVADLRAQEPRVTVRLVHARQDLGLALQRAGRYEESIAVLGSVVADAEALWTADHPSYADVAENYANALGHVGHDAEALAIHLRALEIRTRAFGPTNIDVANSLTNLAGHYTSTGDLGRAKHYLERAIEVQRAVHGDEHPAVIATLNNLGNTLSGLGDLAGAERVIGEALAIAEATMGPDDPLVALLLANLGTCLHARHDLGAAAEVLRRSLAIRQAVLGAHHLDTAYSLHNLGLVELARGDLTVAIDLLEQALAIREPGSDRFTLATTRQALAQALHAADPRSTRARGLHETARAELVALGRTAELAEADTWASKNLAQ